MLYHYRCNDKRNCGARKTLKKPIEQYILKPKCPRCGEDRLRFDPSIKNMRAKAVKCRCDGVPWSQKNGPHWKGSSVWCVHHKDGPTEEDFRERYGK
jgi:rRNA maturation protein Nop10